MCALRKFIYFMMNESRNVECDISSVWQEVRGTNRYLSLKTRLHIQQFNIHLIVKCIRGKAWRMHNTICGSLEYRQENHGDHCESRL